MERKTLPLLRVCGKRLGQIAMTSGPQNGPVIIKQLATLQLIRYRWLLLKVGKVIKVVMMQPTQTTNTCHPLQTLICLGM